MKGEDIAKLEDIPNIGPALASDLRIAGIGKPDDLKGNDGYGLYAKLCAKTGKRHDPCVIDAFLAAVDFMNGAERRLWWRYTPERKKELMRNPGRIVRGK